MKSDRVVLLICFILVCSLFGIALFGLAKTSMREEQTTTTMTTTTTTTTIQVPVKKTITLTAVGDCTIGSDTNFGYSKSFHEVYDKNNDEYFFKGVSSITKNDTITLANLETTFTEADVKAVKKFNFKGPAKYANVLTAGGIEVVNIANNHSHDYLEQGYTDTKLALDAVKVGYAGNDSTYIFDYEGIKVGFLGYSAYNSNKTTIKNAIDTLKTEGASLIVVSYHWGIEREYKQNSAQETLGRWTIDNGADLVIGTHPHVIQGIEKYNGKYIVYSLGNFVFGGNQNPADKDTFLFQETFNFEDNLLQDTSINIIPARVSSVTNYNDYQPTILEGTEKERVYNKILTYSKDI